MKYNYPRADLTIRISGELLALIKEMCADLKISTQDAAAFALLDTFDKSAQCPDWSTINPLLRG